MRPEQFLQVVRGEKSSSIAFRLGTIDSGYVSGRPSVVFDGESSASTKTYPYLSSYSPAADDRVLLALVNHGYVILGKVV